MSNHSDRDNDSGTSNGPQVLEGSENSKNHQNITSKEEEKTLATATDSIGTDGKDVDNFSVNSKSIDFNSNTATQYNSSAVLPITHRHKSTSISDIILNENIPAESQLSTPSEISNISLKSFQLQPLTPRNSIATSSLDINDVFPASAHRRLILCVGVCALDIVHMCEEFPVENAKQLLTVGYWQRGGNASNNCTVLRNLGAACEFLGMMSKLPAFSFLIDDCRDRGIIIENCPLVVMNPPFSSILVCRPSGTFTTIHTNLGFPVLQFQHFKEKIQLNKYTWIHFEARNQEETKPMINMIRRFNADVSSQGGIKPIIISLELAKSDKTLLTLAIRANMIFVGQEFALSLGWSTPKDTVYSLRQLLSVMQLREEKDSDEMDICFPCPHIISPWGSQGCSLLTSSYEYYHIPASEIDHVVDIKGSDDAFVATVIYGMNNLDMELKDAVTLGCQVVVFKLQHMGLDCIKDYTIVMDKSE